MAVEWRAGEEGREEEQIEFSWAGETACRALSSSIEELAAG